MKLINVFRPNGTFRLFHKWHRCSNVIICATIPNHPNSWACTPVWMQILAINYIHGKVGIWERFMTWAWALRGKPSLRFERSVTLSTTVRRRRWTGNTTRLIALLGWRCPVENPSFINRLITVDYCDQWPSLIPLTSFASLLKFKFHVLKSSYRV